MDSFVSFFDSGSLGRAHYTLVRNIETGFSPDQFILEEIRATRSRLHRASLKESKECLVILLYCEMASFNPLPPGSFTFALPNAINLAEAGKSIQDKRIGYLYCSEFIASENEMSLMLVNTLRKDLESSDVARICLATDYIIQNPNEDTVPAIEACLFELLSHNSPAVRRRALLTFRALCTVDPEVFTRTERKVLKRLDDSDQGVVSAALLASSLLVRIDSLARPRHQPQVEALLEAAWDDRYPDALLSAMAALAGIKPSSKVATLISPIIRFGMESGLYTLVRQAFLLLETFDRQVIWDSVVSGILTPVQDIRALLLSESPNHRFLFLTCLESLDPVFWAGSSEEIPAVLDENEVGSVMMLLDSKDHLIRVKTLHVLNKIDGGIIAAYYAQALQTIPPRLSFTAQNEYAARLLEVLAIQHGDDGETYAQNLFEALRVVEAAGQDTIVLEEAVETVLNFIRHGKSSFRIGAVTHLATRLTNEDTRLGPTLMVVVTALLSEYFEQIAVPPDQLLIGMGGGLPSYSGPVQDASILAMLRIAAKCDEVPDAVTSVIEGLRHTGGRYLRKRCDQFLSLTADKPRLELVVKRAKSSALPDFLESLQIYGVNAPQTPPSSPPKSGAALSPTLSGAKLRYEAYAKPTLSPGRRGRRLSSGSSTLSLPSSSSRSGRTPTGSNDALAHTVTPGELALAAGTEEFEMLSKRPSRNHAVEDASKADLIAFDSPFLSEPSEPSEQDQSEEVVQPEDAEPDFEACWNRLEDSNSGARGWCQGTSKEVVEAVRSLEFEVVTIDAEDPPFQGEVKILVAGKTKGPLFVRVKDTEDGSLWRMRSNNPELRLQIKRLLSER